MAGMKRNDLDDALETLTTEDLEQDPEPEVSVSDEDGDECIAAESDGDCGRDTQSESYQE